MRRTALYTLFFLSGVSALIYELVWQRLLNLLFGVSTLSVSAVLAAFMGGLALGGLLLGRVADRTPRPLRLYAWLEAGIGSAGLLVPAAFILLSRVYTALYASLEPGQWGGTCLRLGLAFLILAVPATLLGGTLPLMGRLAVRRSRTLPSAFSLLYAVNTLGAVVGAALTGFVLLRYRGMHETLWIAAGLNFLVALGAGVGSLLRRGSADESVAHFGEMAVHEPTPRPWVALGCAALTGAITMGLEVAWTRILGILTSNSAYGFALLLTVLLVGLALGSLVQWQWSRRHGDSWRRLAICQWLLAAINLAILPFFRCTPAWLVRWCDGGSAGQVFFGELLLTAGALFVPAILMGMSLPLLVGGVTSDPRRFGHWLGRLSAVNTLGCVAGAFLGGFVFIPWLGLRATLGLLIAGTMAVSIVAWTRAPQPSGWRLCRAAALMLLAAGIGWSFMARGGYYKSAVEGPRRLLFYKEGNNATVTVVQEAAGLRTIFVDGQPVAGTVGTSVIDQKMLAHLPLLLHPAPRRALTVGFGSGGTSYSMTLHGIDVDCVEIEGAVPAAAEHFQSENHGVLTHPRFRLILDDARSWLRVAPVRYDVIATDCTNIQYRSNGDLYTVDYFRLMRERLTADGLAAAWVPANGIDESDLKTLLRSFRAVFPHTSVWFMNTLATDFLIVVGTQGELDIDLDQLRRRMLAPGVKEDLEAVGLADPCRLVYTFLAGEEILTAYLGSGPLNTDDRPVLSYTTYGAGFRATIAGNLVHLLACRQDVARFVKLPADSAPWATMMLRHYVASNEAILGHIAFLTGSADAALVHYIQGARLLPSDPALQALVRYVYSGIGRRPYPSSISASQEQSMHPLTD
jgi:spermidine synthase